MRQPGLKKTTNGCENKHDWFKMDWLPVNWTEIISNSLASLHCRTLTRPISQNSWLAVYSLVKYFSHIFVCSASIFNRIPFLVSTFFHILAVLLNIISHSLTVAFSPLQAPPHQCAAGRPCMDLLSLTPPFRTRLCYSRIGTIVFLFCFVL